MLAYAPSAAAKAAALGAHLEAVAHYDSALRYGSSLPPDQTATLLERLGRERFLCSRLDDAISATRAALELRQVLSDRLREGDDLRWLSFFLYPSGRGGEAMRVGAEAVRVLEALPPCRELAWAYVNMCQLSTYEQDGVAVTAGHAQRAVALGERFDDPGVIGQARFHLAATRYLCGVDDPGSDGWEDMETARAATLGVGLVESATFMAMLMGMFGALHHETKRATTALDLVETYSLDHDMPGYLLMSRGSRSRVLVDVGRWDAAADLATAVLGHPSPLPVARIAPLTTVALLRARRGEPQVWPLLDEAVTLSEPTAWPQLGPVRAARAEAAWLDGDQQRAIAEARAGLDTITRHTDPWVTGELARWMHIAGDQPPPLRATEIPALELAGQWGPAAQAWEARDCGYEAALARLSGDVPAIVQALQTFESLGARPAAAIAKARLRDRGARYGNRGPRSRTRANPHGLTARQLEVLELVREGLTGRQIAARLHISPKTADHHVAAILAKLNVQSRAEAARKLRQ